MRKKGDVIRMKKKRSKQGREEQGMWWEAKTGCRKT